MATPTLSRKEKLGTSVRSALNEQLVKIQIKHVAELELLDDIRNFVKQRSQIEKEYAQSMQKLVQQYHSKRDVKAPPTVSRFDRLENRGVLEMWNSLLEKTDELGKRRSTVADLISGSISDEMKTLKRVKEQNFKRQTEIFQLMMSEVLETVRDLTTAKKLYTERWKMCEEARLKFQDGENRLRSANYKMFESKTTLERTQKKNAEKLKLAQKQLVVQRNEYLLSLAEVNTHLIKHFDADLTESLKIIDGELYDSVRNAYVLYSQIEVDSANAVRAEFEDLRDQSSLVNREYVLECFIADNPILRDRISYTFEAAGDDKISSLNRDHEAELYLNKIIDGELYDSVRNAYVLYSQIEVDSANAVRAEFEDLRDQASLAQQSDELNISTDDELEVLEWDDGDGWCKGRSRSGEEGYFPQSYVQAITDIAAASSPRHSTAGVGVVSLEGKNTTKQVMLRAIFEYTAQEDEEISFPEGAVIRLIRTNDNGVDDGWWEGSYEGKVGVFPSVVVEIISGEVNEELTPVSSEVFPQFPSTTSSPTSPIPPPPSYPAPDISANDLSILPVRHLQYNLSSGSTPSLLPNHLRVSGIGGHPLGTSSTASSPGLYRGSDVISGSRRRGGEQPALDQDSFQDSFEDTLQATSKERWSSFDDLNDEDDDSYV